MTFPLFRRRRRNTTESASAVYLAVTTQPVGSTSPNLATQPVVAAKKSKGTTDTSYVTNVVPVLNVLTGSATLGGSEAAGKACVAGVCTFTNLTVTAAAGATWTITFTSGTLTSATSNTGTTTGGGVTAPSVVSSTLLTQPDSGSGSRAYATGTKLTVSGLSGGAIIAFIQNPAAAPTGVRLDNASGAAFTQYSTRLNTAGGYTLDVWYLLAPADGTYGIYVESTYSYGAAIPVALTHVDQATPIDGTATGTQSAGPLATDALHLALAGLVWKFSETETISAGTEIQHNQDASTNMAVASAPGSASTTISWTGGVDALCRIIAVKGA